jgi:hypothetical protein
VTVGEGTTSGVDSSVSGTDVKESVFTFLERRDDFFLDRAPEEPSSLDASLGLSWPGEELSTKSEFLLSSRGLGGRVFSGVPSVAVTFVAVVAVVLVSEDCSACRGLFVGLSKPEKTSSSRISPASSFYTQPKQKTMLGWEGCQAFQMSPQTYS